MPGIINVNDIKYPIKNSWVKTISGIDYDDHKYIYENKKAKAIWVRDDQYGPRLVAHKHNRRHKVENYEWGYNLPIPLENTDEYYHKVFYISNDFDRYFICIFLTINEFTSDGHGAVYIGFDVTEYSDERHINWNQIDQITDGISYENSLFIQAPDGLHVIGFSSNNKKHILINRDSITTLASFPVKVYGVPANGSSVPISDDEFELYVLIEKNDYLETNGYIFENSSWHTDSGYLVADLSFTKLLSYTIDNENWMLVFIGDSNNKIYYSNITGKLTEEEHKLAWYESNVELLNMPAYRNSCDAVMIKAEEYSEEEQYQWMLNSRKILNYIHYFIFGYDDTGIQTNVSIHYIIKAYLDKDSNLKWAYKTFKDVPIYNDHGCIVSYDIIPQQDINKKINTFLLVGQRCQNWMAIWPDYDLYITYKDVFLHDIPTIYGTQTITSPNTIIEARISVHDYIGIDAISSIDWDLSFSSGGVHDGYKISIIETGMISVLGVPTAYCKFRLSNESYSLELGQSPQMDYPMGNRIDLGNIQVNEVIDSSITSYANGSIAVVAVYHNANWDMACEYDETTEEAYVPYNINV